MSSTAHVTELIDPAQESPRDSGTRMVGLIVLLLAATTVLVYSTGGTQYSWPYLMLIPVMLGAARFHVAGGIVAGLIAAALLGPWMPLDVAAGVAQDTRNWMLRAAFYAALGGFMGGLFLLIQRDGQRRQRLARIDAETGLPNKTALMDTLRRHVEERCAPLLLLIRIVDLPEIVQAAGVPAADDLLVELDRRVQRTCSEGGAVYRFSAAELMLVDPEPTRSPEEVARAVAASVEQPVELRGVPVRTELAIGSVDATDPELSPEDQVRQARTALVAAVDGKIPHVSYAPEQEEQIDATVALLTRVRAGLEQDQFELHYQPKLRTADGTVEGCEGLIRWLDERGRCTPPDEFIPEVEHSALIDPLTRFVVETACRTATRIDGTMGVNISARNLLDPGLVSLLSHATSSNGLKAERIELEITESAIVQDPDAARGAIEDIRGHGFRVSLDDFGTGYSSFEYLRLLPLTGLKIDRAFIRDLAHDPRAGELMACMIRVGQALELEVVAEGVENRQQFEILRELGCDLVQGFWFARPMAAADYLAWLRQQRPADS